MDDHIDDEQGYRTPGPARLQGEARFLTKGRAWADTVAALVLLAGWFLLATEQVFMDSPGAQYALLVAGIAMAGRAFVLFVMAAW